MFNFLTQPLTGEGGGALPLTAGAISTLTVELVKWIARRFIVKNPDFDFPPIFYTLCIPFFTAFWGIILFLVGIDPSSDYTWGILLEWGLAIIVALATYTLTVKPLKEYSKSYKNSAG